MTVAAFMRLLASIPEPPAEPARGLHQEEVERSVAYLASPQALASLQVDSYWPKWHSPWWHMLLLHERGDAARIPQPAVEALVRALDGLPMKTFPIRDGDAPAGFDPYRDVSCHCALGCIVPLLLECGVDVDAALPWAPDWFVRYQMSDGGLNCDDAAYRCADETPSSMVGTVAPFEAVLALGARRARAEEFAFLDRGAAFLIGRGLVRGSATVHNAEERSTAPEWQLPTFPRYYFYDVLRGLSALVAWAARYGKPLPLPVVSGVVEGLVARHPDGRIRVGRRAFDGKKTIVPGKRGEPPVRVPASTFPLLEASSRIDDVSGHLTRQWWATVGRLRALGEAGLLVE